ncbi:hypothetical protein CAI21_21760 [Alkalilimnicola ehrlichii]|uniref:Toxin VasX N-terminal region domain-containing protein n=1 Tax=Alkalilimnicola ehrlichii TaxID=351052 RepID=A0A3E0WT95_9GAMM|nr:toxin VasX [Alkalilimnicola ehrlichii]RFA24403.1 hypothetical protein CAI21_21760 [Alkalilimnicola ehrlichii]RFA35187.1 hypothetical protein CAL65_13880 [Alkalilimnicola ehrlichii]
MVDLNDLEIRSARYEGDDTLVLTLDWAQYVTLFPLRYGLVDKAQAARTIASPYGVALQSGALGPRSLRDGYLYIVEHHNRDGMSPTPEEGMHEYRISEGELTPLMLGAHAVDADERDEAVAEATPILRFRRDHVLFVTFSEVQWSAKKCRQVLEDVGERRRVMQKVDMRAALSEQRARHLATLNQAQRWVDELTQYAPALGGGESPDDGPNEAPALTLVDPAGLGETLPERRHSEAALLLVRDDLGLLRDLADYQDAVTEWVEAWAGDSERERRYLIGSLIESLYLVDQKGLLARSDDPRFQALLDETTAEQREGIFEYLTVHGEQNRDGFYDWRRRAAFVGFSPITAFPGIRETFWDAKDVREADKALQEVLGEELYARHKPTIDAYADELQALLFGARFGQLGLAQLIKRQEMEAFCTVSALSSRAGTGCLTASPKTVSA